MLLDPSYIIDIFKGLMNVLGIVGWLLASLFLAMAGYYFLYKVIGLRFSVTLRN